MVGLRHTQLCTMDNTWFLWASIQHNLRWRSPRAKPFPRCAPTWLPCCHAASPSRFGRPWCNMVSYHYLFSSALCLEATLFPDVKASCWPDCTLSPNWHSGVWCGHQTSPTSQAGGLSVADPWIDSRSTEARQRAYQRCAGRVKSGRVPCKGQDALGSAGPKQCDPGA